MIVKMLSTYSHDCMTLTNDLNQVNDEKGKKAFWATRTYIVQDPSSYQIYKISLNMYQRLYKKIIEKCTERNYFSAKQLSGNLSLPKNVIRIQNTNDVLHPSVEHQPHPSYMSPS